MKWPLLFTTLVALAPFFADAQTVTTNYQFQRDGIFGCSVHGAYSLGVARLAGSGTFVPVNDAAVTLNTGYLVYKECVLDGVAKRQAEAGAASLVKRGASYYVTGRGGKPMFLVEWRPEVLERLDPVVLDRVQDANLAPMCTALKDTVRTAVVRSYLGDSRTPNRAVACSLGGTTEEQRALLLGQPEAFTWERLYALSKPQNRPLDAFYQLRGYIDSSVNEELDIFKQQMAWGRGTYPVERIDRTSGFTRRLTMTPGAIVAGNIQQLLGSGFRQLESGNEIDQMVGSLFAGLSTQAFTDVNGLIGLTRQGSQGSYLDRLTAESTGALRTAIVNTAITHLNSARSTQAAYLEALNEIAKNLTESIGKLRAAEQRCWELVIPKAREHAENNGFQIRAATSTVASQAVIDDRIAEYARAIAEDITDAQDGLRLINEIIAGVTGTSLQAQQLAVEQLDSLVAAGRVKTSGDVQETRERRDAVASALEDLITDTLTDWGDGADPAVGWCNINNDNVPRLWAEEWRI